MSDNTGRHGSVIPVDAGSIMETSYIAYMHEAILDRALPDARDGLKPVHRRILYTMHQSYPATGPYKKSARIVGDTMGKYHPHGDSSIYEAMVNMSQNWKLTAPMVDGQGNFGSADGDKAAAMRYTEARMTRLGSYITADLAELPADGPHMTPTYDEEELEPLVLPTAYPTALVNGSAGIAVGMSCSAPPYNLAEVCKAAIARMRNPDLTFQELTQIVPAPDFPNGCIISGAAGIREAMQTGRGSIHMQGHASIVEEKGKEYISVRSLPYYVKKSDWLAAINTLVNDKRITGISEIRDRSNRNGMDVRINLRRDANASIVLSALYRYTALRSSFPVNSTYIIRGIPHTCGFLEMLDAWIEFRIETVYDKTEYRVNRLRDQMKKHIAMWIARYDIDQIIEILRSSANPEEAVSRISQLEYSTEEHQEIHSMLRIVEPDKEVPASFAIGQEMATHISQQRLRVLTGTEMEKVLTQIASVRSEIAECEHLLHDSDAIKAVIIGELETIITKYGVPRASELMAGSGGDVADADLIQTKDVLLSMTRNGYLKTIDADAFRDQRRGGVGRSGMPMREDDELTLSFFCSNKANLLFFTAKGMSYMIPAWRIEEGSISSKGRFIANYLGNMDADDHVTNVIVKPEVTDGKSIMFVTSEGSVRRSDAAAFDNMNSSGKIAMKLPDGVRIVSVFLATDDEDDIFLYSSAGFGVRFHITDDVIRTVQSRASTGMRGIRLGRGEECIGGLAIPHMDFTYEEREEWLKGDEGNLSAERRAEFDAKSVDILTVTEDGFGKRFPSNSINATSRGNKGVSITAKKYRLLLCRVVSENDSLTITLTDGQTIRIPVRKSIPESSRATRGVKLVNLKETDATIATVSVITKTAEEIADDELEQEVQSDVDAGEADEGDAE